MATNSNSETAKRRMEASSVGSVGMRAKKNESSTGCVWAACFHHVTARSHMTCLLNL
jgi:hypothetical protein